MTLLRHDLRGDLAIVGAGTGTAIAQVPWIDAICGEFRTGDQL